MPARTTSTRVTPQLPGTPSPAKKAKAGIKANSKGKEESEADGLLPPDPNSGPSRRSARQANRKWNEDYADFPSTPIKAEDTESPPKANVGAKRSAPGVDSERSKRVKFERDAAGEIKTELRTETGLVSPPSTSEDEHGSVSDEDLEESSGEDAELGSVQPKAKKTKAKATAKGKGKQTKTTPSSMPVKKSPSKMTQSPENKAAALQAKKLKEYSQYSKQSPFPDFVHPTAEEARLAHRILAKLHGERTRPEKVVARNDRAGCGDSPSVLDALVRTILSQNTSDKNSTRAKLSMDQVYGGSDKWDKIIEGGQEKLQKAIESGGLSVVKSKVIINILNSTQEKYGTYSLDHLFDKTDEEAMHELISLKGVGPKTASCVLLFCLQRESFAVDTHVYRIAGLLGWRPPKASRDETHSHLEVRIPDEEKYGLHILMVGHGKKCDECKAGGKSTGKCELRRAFRKAKLAGDAGEEVKEEEEEEVKQEGVKPEKIKQEDLDWEDGQGQYIHGMEGKSGNTSAKGQKKGPRANKKR